MRKTLKQYEYSLHKMKVLWKLITIFFVIVRWGENNIHFPTKARIFPIDGCFVGERMYVPASVIKFDEIQCSLSGMAQY